MADAGDPSKQAAAAAPVSRPRKRRSRRSPAGTSPGTLVTDPAAPKPVLRAIAYGPDALDEVPLARPEDVRPLLERHRVTWVNVDGLGDAGVIERLGALFGLHRLALEDVVNTHQRAKLERYGGHSFIVLRMSEAVPGDPCTEQLSLFFGPGFVLTFQERAGDCFDRVRQRLRAGKGRLRSSGPDYLAYALIDSVVDAYFPVVEADGERLDRLEDDILRGAQPTDLVAGIHGVRRDLLELRRALWPLREVVSALQREEDPALSAETRLHLRDVYDHVVNLLDMLENLREVAGGLMELHLSAVSHRMNEIMKVLTVFSTIFMPLTFIVGVYGMNFDPDASPWSMPELRWALGYPGVLLLMAATAAAMLLFFRRRGWIGRRGPAAAALGAGERAR